MKISVQETDFNAGIEIAQLRAKNSRIGAIASFIGLVRDNNDGDAVTAMTLEHYPAMSVKVLRDIAEQAHLRWQIEDVTVIHRTGKLQLCDQIVLVVVAASHRHDTFLACEFIMDFLKTAAPFWKKEHSAQGARWVESRAADEDARLNWLDPSDISSR